MKNKWYRIIVMTVSIMMAITVFMSCTDAPSASSDAVTEKPSSEATVASEAAASQTAEELTKVNVGMTPYSMYAIWAIAKDLGIDKEYGLDIELFDFAGTAQGAQACVRGDVDITASCVAEHLTSIVGAPNLVNFMPVGYFKGFFYVGRASDIEPWDDLVNEMGLDAAKEARRNEFKGKAFCIIPQRKSLILDTLAQVGLTEDDVTLVNFADDQKAATAFLAGEGDFYIGSLPQQRTLLKDEQFVNAGGSDILGPAGLWYDTMMTTDEYLNSNQDTALKLLAVFYSTVNEFDKNPDKVAEVAAAYLSKATGSDFAKDEWLEMQTKFDDFQSLEEAQAGFYNKTSDLYWGNSVQYQIDLQTADGTLPAGVSGEQYYGGSEKLFNALLANQQLVDQINSHK